MIDQTGTADFRDLPTGAEVHTADGDKIGEVREFRQGSFKVSAAMQPDYWLPTRTVASILGDRVTLNFDKDRLGDYKSDQPLAA